MIYDMILYYMIDKNIVYNVFSTAYHKNGTVRQLMECQKCGSKIQGLNYVQSPMSPWFLSKQISRLWKFACGGFGQTTLLPSRPAVEMYSKLYCFTDFPALTTVVRGSSWRLAPGRTLAWTWSRLSWLTELVDDPFTPTGITLCKHRTVTNDWTGGNRLSCNPPGSIDRSMAMYWSHGNQSKHWQRYELIDSLCFVKYCD